MNAKTHVAVVALSAAFLAGCGTTERARPLTVSPATSAQVMDDDFSGDKPNLVTPYLAFQQEDSDSGLAIGADYEYRIKQGIGVGGLIEYSGGEIDATVLAAAVYLRPEEPLRLLVGVGMERRHGDNDFLLRLGGSYAFPLEGELTLAPGVYIDFVDGDQKFILGVGLGISF